MGAKRREPSEEPHRALDNWRAYLFIIVLMAERARAERRGQGGRGGPGPHPPGRGARQVFFFVGFYLFFTPRGRGGGQRAVCPGTSRAKAMGRERAGASGGRVGERIISPARFNCPKVAR